jgi:hypothetical protein
MNVEGVEYGVCREARSDVAARGHWIQNVQQSHESSCDTYLQAHVSTARKAVDEQRFARSKDRRTNMHVRAIPSLG